MEPFSLSVKDTDLGKLIESDRMPFQDFFSLSASVFTTDKELRHKERTQTMMKQSNKIEERVVLHRLAK